MSFFGLVGDASIRIRRAWLVEHLSYPLNNLNGVIIFKCCAKKIVSVKRFKITSYNYRKSSPIPTVMCCHYTPIDSPGVKLPLGTRIVTKQERHLPICISARLHLVHPPQNSFVSRGCGSVAGYGIVTTLYLCTTLSFATLGTGRKCLERGHLKLFCHERVYVLMSNAVECMVARLDVIKSVDIWEYVSVISIDDAGNSHRFIRANKVALCDPLSSNVRRQH